MTSRGAGAPRTGAVHAGATSRDAEGDPAGVAGSGGDRVAGPHVLLVGMMGAGKTTIGRRLAGRLQWRYVDSDDEVEAMTGHTVKELFESGGEAAFRPLESQALARAIAAEGPAVVSVAGGAVLDPANRQLLRRSGIVVWLRAAPATLAARVQAATERPHRPLLGTDPAGAIERLDAVRQPLYAEVADVVVDVDALTPEEVVDRVRDQVPERTR